MNSIYEKNIQALRKKSERTVDFLEYKINQEKKGWVQQESNEKNTFDEKGLNENIEIITEKSDSGETIFKVEKDNKVYYLNGKRNPNSIPEIWMNSFDKLPKTAPIIMFGIGNGSFIKELAKKVTEKVYVFIYEPSVKIFLRCLEEIDLSEEIEKLDIVFGINNNITFKEIGTVVESCVNLENLEFMKKYILPGYYQLYPMEAKKFLEIAQKAVVPLVTYFETKSAFSTVAMENMLHNAMFLPDCHTSLQLVDVIPRDMPAIVVAAGPSLNKNIKELKRAEGKAFIIACDTAIKPLLREGIVPDMFVIIDGKKPLNLIDVPGAENIPLLTSIIAAKSVLQFHKGKKFFYNENITYINKTFQQFNIPFKPVATGGSVATSAFALSYMIGLDTIILVGQDLALTGNKTHADGTFEEKMETIDTSDCEMVPGNYEKEVPTRGDFKLYLDWYNDYIEGCKSYRPNLRVINATDGGARIKDTEVMTLKEAIDECCKKEVDIKSRIGAIKPAFYGEKRNWVIDYLKKTEKGFVDVAENAVKQRKVYQKIDNMAKTGHISNNEYGKLLNKLQKLTKEVLKSPYYLIVDDTLINANLILRRELLVEEKNLLEEARELSRKGLIYMELVENCATLYAGVASESISTVK